MKKTIKSMMYLLAASSLLLASCGDDEDVKDAELTLTYQALDPIAGVPYVAGLNFVGDSLKIMVTGKGNSDNNLKSITVTKAVVGQQTQTIYEEDLSGTDLVYNFADVSQLADTAGVTYTFTLTSKEGNAQVKTFVTEVVESEPTEDLKVAVTLYGQTNTSANSLNFMKLTPAYSPFSQTDLKEADFVTCDMGFFYGNTNKATIASTDDTDLLDLYNLESWAGVARKTGFYKFAAGSVNYEACVASEEDKVLYNLAYGKTFVSKANTLIPGDVVLYVTENGKLGLVKIKALNPPTNRAASNAEMDLVLLSQLN